MIVKNAYAKVNLFLNVKGEREDGYHDLEMVNISIDLADKITFKSTNKDEIILETSDLTLNSKNNLSYKVAQYMKKSFSISGGVSIYIEKHIPVGGGLAGGSSDAAATIKGLNELWGLNLSFEEMFEISKRFGSDTPYCLFEKPAMVTGKGDIIKELNIDISKYEISLFNSKEFVSTGDVFSHLKKTNKYNLEEAVKSLQSNDYHEFCKGLRNDLLETVLEYYPAVSKQYDILKRLYGEEGLFMTGSGSTLVKISEKI